MDRLQNTYRTDIHDAGSRIRKEMSIVYYALNLVDAEADKLSTNEN